MSKADPAKFPTFSPTGDIALDAHKFQIWEYKLASEFDATDVFVVVTSGGSSVALPCVVTADRTSGGVIIQDKAPKDKSTTGYVRVSLEDLYQVYRLRCQEIPPRDLHIEFHTLPKVRSLKKEMLRG